MESLIRLTYPSGVVLATASFEDLLKVPNVKSMSVWYAPGTIHPFPG